MGIFKFDIYVNENDQSEENFYWTIKLNNDENIQSNNTILEAIINQYINIT